MTKPQTQAAMERMGFPMAHAHPAPYSLNDPVIESLEVTEPYQPSENCVPAGDLNCTRITLILAENPKTHRRELSSFGVYISLAHAALISNLIDPAIRKYGSPNLHSWSQDRDPNTQRGRWRWVWLPSGTERGISMSIEIKGYGIKHEPGPNETSSTIEIDAVDANLFAARSALNDQRRRNAPPPIKY